MRTATLLAMTALVAVHVTYVDAAERSARRGAVNTADGGIAAGKAVRYSGTNGAAGVHGHAIVTDGNGNVKAISGAAGHTVNGGTYGRAGATTANAAGTVTHRAGAAAQGPRGSAKTSSSFTRSADGTYNGQRSTSAQGANGSNYSATTSYANGSGTHATNVTAKNGDTYSGTTTWTQGQGATHSGTCKDPSGNGISCPSR